MEENKKEEIFMLLDNIIKQAQLIVQLATKEARLALYSLKAIFILTIFLALIGISIWFILLAFCWYGFYFYTHSISIAFAGLLFVNALIYCCARLVIKVLRNNLSFKATRQQLLSVGVTDAA